MRQLSTALSISGKKICNISKSVGILCNLWKSVGIPSGRSRERIAQNCLSKIVKVATQDVSINEKSIWMVEQSILRGCWRLIMKAYIQGLVCFYPAAAKREWPERPDASTWFCVRVTRSCLPENAAQHAQQARPSAVSTRSSVFRISKQHNAISHTYFNSKQTAVSQLPNRSAQSVKSPYYSPWQYKPTFILGIHFFCRCSVLDTNFLASR